MEEENKVNFSWKFILIILIVLVVGLILGLIFMGKDTKLYNSIFVSDKDKAVVKNSLGDNFVAYVPLDDRPVNVDRVKYLSESMGYTLKMPELDLYSTKLDGNGTNSNGTQYGDPYKLAKWLQEMETSGCDYYIISLDQLFSGGLANSRIFTDNDISERNIDMEFVKYVFESIVSDNTNKVYLYDSVMRLASTNNYRGFVYSDYNALYKYGSKERVILDNDNLTLDNIVNGYKYDKDNNIINANIDGNKLNKYLSARERKLRLIDYYFNVIEGKNNVKLYVGIDDSSTSNNIQTNEVNYINKIIKNKNLDVIVRDGIDELGMMAFTRLVSDKSNYTINVKTSYYGGSENGKYSKYTSMSVKDNYEYLIDTLDVEHVSDGEDISILIFTNPSDVNLVDKYAIDLVNQYIENINNRIPTVIIDCSDQKYGKLFEEILVNNAPIGYLIGYSSWNEYSNSIGIAVSEGITRYLYLIGNNKNEDSDKAFVKFMTFSFIKDMVYKGNVESILGSVSSSDIVSKYMTTYNIDVIRSLENSNFITNMNDYTEKSINMITLSNYNFPWNRLFEMSFDIDLNIGKRKDIVINSIVIQDDNNDAGNGNNDINDNDLDNNDNSQNDNSNVENNDNNNQSDNSDTDSNDDVVDNDNNVDDGIVDEDSNVNDNVPDNNNHDEDNNNVENDDFDNKEDNNNVENDDSDNKEDNNIIDNKIIHYAFINDSVNKDGKFYPEDYISRKEIAKWVCSVNNLDIVTTYTGYYSDVKRGSSNWDYIETATKYGYFKGDNKGKFNPNKYITRAELVSLLIQIAENNNINIVKVRDISFSDVSADKWYYDEVKIASEAGIIYGYKDGTFKPNNYSTRAEAVAVISRLFGRDKEHVNCTSYSDKNPFADVNKKHWAYNYLIEAYYEHSCSK